MLSARKQKANEKRPRQSDVMSELGNMDVMLGSYSRGELDDHQNEDEMEVDTESNRLQRYTIPIIEDFISLLNSNSRENSDITAVTIRIINEQITS